MSSNFVNLIVLFTVSIWMTACQDEPVKPKPQKGVTQKEMVDHNRKSVRMESDQIDKYIARREWEMNKTGSGLHYMIYEESGSDVRPKQDDTVYVAYKVSLINGKQIYKSDPDNPASFIVGHDEVESGLQEGIKYLGVGDKAMLIIPSHLAHGYTGDFNKIPHSSTVIFDITLIRIND